MGAGVGAGVGANVGLCVGAGVCETTNRLFVLFEQQNNTTTAKFNFILSFSSSFFFFVNNNVVLLLDCSRIVICMTLCDNKILLPVGSSRSLNIHSFIYSFIRYFIYLLFIRVVPKLEYEFLSFTRFIYFADLH